MRTLILIEGLHILPSLKGQLKSPIATRQGKCPAAQHDAVVLDHADKERCGQPGQGHSQILLSTNDCPLALYPLLPHY